MNDVTHDPIPASAPDAPEGDSTLQLLRQQLRRYGEDLAEVYRSNKAHAEWLSSVATDYQAIFEAIAIPVLVADGNLVVARANSAWRRLPGGQACVGQHLTQALEGPGIARLYYRLTLEPLERPAGYHVHLAGCGASEGQPIRAIATPRGVRSRGFVITAPLAQPLPDRSYAFRDLVEDAVVAATVPVNAAGAFITKRLPETTSAPGIPAVALFRLVREALIRAGRMQHHSGAVRLEAMETRGRQVLVIGIPRKPEAAGAPQGPTGFEALEQAVGDAGGTASLKTSTGPYAEFRLEVPVPRR